MTYIPQKSVSIITPLCDVEIRRRKSNFESKYCLNQTAPRNFAISSYVVAQNCWIGCSQPLRDCLVFRVKLQSFWVKNSFSFFVGPSLFAYLFNKSTRSEKNSQPLPSSGLFAATWKFFVFCIALRIILSMDSPSCYNAVATGPTNGSLTGNNLTLIMIEKYVN